MRVRRGLSVSHYLCVFVFLLLLTIDFDSLRVRNLFSNHDDGFLFVFIGCQIYNGKRCVCAHFKYEILVDFFSFIFGDVQKFDRNKFNFNCLTKFIPAFCLVVDANYCPAYTVSSLKIREKASVALSW